ncbi:interleukin-17A-like [Bufo bufo]|uniref:interleukin-17A-like n=1 Tax=Bufo bufo TaxID=8384 RepID=UPI001ABDE233|nr:interleukin-17A-like [Bufo bufo]XP_040285782.1 interleukin-17A-like [Bufo bufo]
MDILTGTCKFTAVLLLLGVTTLMSVQCLDLHRHKGCPPVTKFPSTVKVSLNMSGQDSLLLSGDVRKRSTSPWEYSYDKNIHRQPMVIAEAKCELSGCIDAEGKVDNNLNSVPIRQEILVLHREMKGCVPVFTLEKKIVTVGCTCVRAVIQEQQ